MYFKEGDTNKFYQKKLKQLVEWSSEGVEM